MTDELKLKIECDCCQGRSIIIARTPRDNMVCPECNGWGYVLMKPHRGKVELCASYPDEKERSRAVGDNVEYWKKHKGGRKNDR